MDNYAINRIVDLERAVNKLKISAALVTPTTYTIDWIRDQLEADASFSAWIITMLETNASFYNWIVSSLEADTNFYTWIVTTLKADATFYSWIVTSLEADTSFYTWLINKIEADTAFYTWLVNKLEADTAFYTWFRNALNADATFISALITSFQGDTGFTSWVRSTATYSKESFITLNRSATLSLPLNTITVVTWQQNAVRRSNTNTTFQTDFIYSGPSTNITIPQNGYYNVSFSGATDVATTQRYVLQVGGVNMVSAYNGLSAALWSFSTTQYFTTNQVISLALTAVSAAAVLQVNTEWGLNQSPYLHIVKVNAAG